MKSLFRSILAGMFIGIGAAAFLLTGNAFVFTIGIFLVFNFTGHLITGYCPSAAYTKRVKIKDIGIIILGNSIGSYLFAILMSMSRMQSKVFTKARELIQIKMNDSYLSIFILGVFCAVLIGYAVIGAARAVGFVGSMIYLLFSTYIFVVLGLEHIVANIFYATIALGFNIIDAIPFLLVSLLGNLVGGLLTGFIQRKVE